MRINSYEKLADDVVGGLKWERFLGRIKIFISAIYVGICKAATDYSLGYALERVAFGKPIAYHQAISFMLADMDILSKSVELLLR